MKKIILFCLILPLASKSQVYKLRAFKTELAVLIGNKYIVKDSNSTNILVVVNLDKKKVQTYGEAEVEYDLTKQTSNYIDEFGKQTTGFEAVDKNGDKCRITFIINSEERKEITGIVAGVAITYDKVIISYILRKND